MIIAVCVCIKGLNLVKTENYGSWKIFCYCGNNFVFKKQFSESDKIITFSRASDEFNVRSDDTLMC